MPDIYEYTGKLDDQIESAKNFDVVEYERITFSEEGTLTYIKGEKYPLRQGMATKEVHIAMNIAKRAFMVMLKLMRSPIVICFIRPKWALEKGLSIYLSLIEDTFKPIILKQKYRSQFSVEVETFVGSFLRELGVETLLFPNIIAHIFEYDAAYRFRVVDLLSETSEDELSAYPQKTIKRLALLSMEREYAKEVSVKMSTLSKLVMVALYIPKFKKAFRSALTTVHYEYLVYDNLDTYWALKRNDYKAFGLSEEEKKQKLESMI